MADQVFAVNSGFYDAVEKDRTYSANDMNRPYKRVICNGVFAQPDGTPSDDLQVYGSSGMTIYVQPGEGLFGWKWFENPNILSITVPANNALTTRIDSVIAQVDTQLTGRVGNIVYRTGTPSNDPVPPDINTVEGVYEYRLANVTVAASASQIPTSAITDLRGSEECPWVTSLIQQVDTSTLWAQWQSAYEQFYNDSTSTFSQYEQQRMDDWDEFFSTLTQELTISTNVIFLYGSYTTTGQTTTIPVNVQSYNPTSDILSVYINGLFADPTMYTYQSGSNSIVLSNALEASQRVDCVVMKNVMTGGVQDVATAIQTLENRIAAYHSDSGWVNVALTNGTPANNALYPAIRTIGERVYIRGAVKGLTALGTLFTLPAQCAPQMQHIFTVTALNGSTVNSVLTASVDTEGNVSLIAKSANISATDIISIATDFVTG